MATGALTKKQFGSAFLHGKMAPENYHRSASMTPCCSNWCLEAGRVVVLQAGLSQIWGRLIPPKCG